MDVLDPREVMGHGNKVPGGPSSQELAALFEPFRSKKPAGREGLGLGLYIARRIVEMHGGTISVESAEGEGAAFTVELPIASGEHEGDVIVELPLEPRGAP